MPRKEKSIRAPLTFQEAQRRHVERAHRAAVYGCLMHYLARYLPNDLGEPMESIDVTNCAEPKVSRHVLEVIFAELRATRNTALRVCARIETTPVTVDKRSRRVTRAGH